LTSPSWGPSISEFQKRIVAILKAAYDWNYAAKCHILDFDLIPFLPTPGAKWDGTEMKNQDRSQPNVPGEWAVVSAISIGLKASIALRSGPYTHVQMKSEVLIMPADTTFRRGRVAGSSLD